MEDYLTLGIVFACVSLVYNLLVMRYFLPKVNEEIYKNSKEVNSDDALGLFFSLQNIQSSITAFGFMFAWIFCWPAMILFKIIKLFVLIIKGIVSAIKS